MLCFVKNSVVSLCRSAMSTMKCIHAHVSIYILSDRKNKLILGDKKNKDMIILFRIQLK
jgi:hypothetical protein